MDIFNFSVVIPQIIESLAIGQVVGWAADKNIVFIICAASLAAFLWALLREDKTEPGTLTMGGGGL